MASTEAGTSEYDRFGPWIDEVRTHDDVPPLYRDHPLDLAATRLVLKVPRNIARRDAAPDMDLYDHLLIVEHAGLTILSRRGQRESSGRPSGTPGGYDVRNVQFRDVVAIRDTVNLLDGRLTLHTSTGDEMSVRYNGSARDSVGRLIDELRAAVVSNEPSPVGHALLQAGEQAGHTSAHLDLGRDDLSLVSDFRDVAGRLTGGLTPWAWHGRVHLTRRASGAARVGGRILDAVTPMTLQGILLAGDNVALEVFARRDWAMRGTKPVHSSSRLMVPLSAPGLLTLTAHPRYDNTSIATLTAGASVFDLVVPEGSEPHLFLERVVEARSVK